MLCDYGTGYGKLTFGSGTRLSVQPNPSLPNLRLYLASNAWCGWEGADLLEISCRVTGMSADGFCWSVKDCVNTGNHRPTLGTGTRLVVKPNITPSPSVYRLISKDDEDLEMCLITDYSPEKLKSKAADKQTNALVEVATPENNQEVSYLSTYWAKKDEMQCGANHEGVGELNGEDPESGASTVCVTEVSLNFRTDENLNMLSLSQLGLKVILMKGIIFNVLMTMLMWKKKNASSQMVQS